DAHLEDRLVLDGGDVRRLGRVRRRTLSVARPRHLRAPGRLPTPKLASPGGLAPRRSSHLLPRGPVGAAAAIDALATAARMVARWSFVVHHPRVPAHGRSVETPSQVPG